MHVVDLTTLYLDGGEGGVNTYLLEKARYLSQRGGYTHTIVVPGRKNESTQLHGATIHKVKSPSLPGNPQHRILVDLSQVCSVLKSSHPDVVEVDCSYLLGRAARRVIGERRVPIVGFYHVHLPMLYSRPVRNFLRRHVTKRTEPMAWRYAQFCARPCDRVVVTSRDIYRRLNGRRFPPVELLPLGVNLDLFQPRNGAGRPPIPGINPNRPVMLYVGRLSPEKNLPMLFRAHELLHERQGAQLVIAGDGPERKKTLRFAAENDGVSFIGTCRYGDKLARLYQGADVLIAPGASETFGLTVLEAFASGLPVVTAGRGGSAELVGPGVGELAKPGSAEDFAAKVESVLKDRPQAEHCRRHVEERYSWEVMFDRLADLYGEVRQELAPSSAEPAVEPA